MKKFDISVLITVHRRIETARILINSIIKNSISNVQIVVCGDRSFLPSVDTNDHMPVTEYFKKRNDFFFIKHDTPKKPIYEKLVFVESENTRNIIEGSSPIRKDLPVFNYMYYAASYVIPYCNSDLILGPTEDDLYFIKEWDTEYLKSVKDYNPLEHIYIHHEINSNHCIEYQPSMAPSGYPLTCNERHNLINKGKNMMDSTVIKRSDIEKFGAVFKRHGSVKVYDIPPPIQDWPISEHGPFLIHKELLNRIGLYHGNNFNSDMKLGVYGNPRSITDLLYNHGIKKMVHNTRIILFHNMFKQKIIEDPMMDDNLFVCYL